MKKNVLLWPLLSLLVTSCSLFPLQFVAYHDYVEIPSQPAATVKDNYYIPEAYSDDYTSEFRSHKWETERTINLRSTGRQNLLVIPVEVSDYPASGLEAGIEGSRILIQNAFFGQANKTQWESVASYYNQSSYGRLVLGGSVSEWYPSGYSVNQLSTLANNKGKTYVSELILQEAVEWYKSTHDDIADFDLDEDGFVDAVYLIYSSPYASRSSLFWAYTSFDTGNIGSEHLGDPVANAYAWSSFDFLNVYNNKPDAHTLIHESGHLFGLADYYNTSSAILATAENAFDYGNTYGPTGRVDMMDYSVGDHTVYSKMALNWTRPKVVTDSGTLTLRPFAWEGESILIKNNWNGSAMDEYLALEFYTPTKLNYADSQSAYGSVRLMKGYGIKVYHVDARLGYYRTDNSGTFLGYVDTTPITSLPADVQLNETYYKKIAHTNTSFTSENGYPLYHLLESSGENTFLEGEAATNDTLFQAGDSFGVETFQDFMFHDGSALGYTFTIDSLTTYSAQITVTKLG